ncbi:MAG: flavodoxin family protein [Nitrospirae bacterium]|nr:MAG: flavodoxin family protein [Nitrospirota bacterium]
MKIIAFQGSPRKDGNTELLLNEIIRGAGEHGSPVRTYKLNLMKIRPCQDCGGCDQTGVCILEDDMGPVYDDIRTADRIILASPIFFFGLSAQAKALVDRCQSFWCEKYLLKKPIEEGPFGRKGLLVLVGGMKKEIGIECGNASAKAFFRTISVSEHTVLSFLGVDAKGAIKDHPTALAEAYETGKALAKS